ncbi:DNA adenine methylase [Bacillus cytotoxicus]|uniref:Site-specific DNA-methyltransferase (adenine-specific) n=1 Tax=Bacillus cytotoxicus TaxID=580165 RepID=A0AAX2CEV4_9BACI|nr:DNA adenine methylase [Bacillus cytotoxicus]SCL85868.1 Modification methylase MjaIII [Bacillus cytotoxicus]
MDKIHAKPFIKWAGGKRQLLSQFDDLYPNKLKTNNIKRYIEAFIGGGAVFFELISRYDFEEVILNDINKDLILSYIVIKHNVEELIMELRALKNQFMSLEQEQQSEMFYNIRKNFNLNKHKVDYDTAINTAELCSEHILQASYFLFLNKTCFNGLYRENRSGEFNVPFGKYKNPSILDEDNMRNVNKALKNVTLKCGDFTKLLPFIDENTFVYMDPPYRPLNVTSSFKSYSKGDFNDEDQKRLAEWFKEASTTGACLMLSNSNPKNTNSDDNFFEELYKGFNIIEVFASRAINSKASGRGAISELVIRFEKEA